MAAIIGRLVQWRNSINPYRKYQLGPNSTTKEIEEPLARLHCDARALRVEEDPYVQATSRAIELVLYLSWPPQVRVDLTLLASELKEDLSQLQVRPCVYMDLTSFHLMIGAISADKGTQTRAWFVGKISRVVLAMRMRGWGEKLRVLERGLTSDTSLRPQLKALWKEINNEE